MPSCQAIIRRMLGLASAWLLLLGACSPSPSGDREATAFDRADTNKDGVVDLGEWDQASARRFSEVDADGDGQWSAAELAQAFEYFDLNGDGVIDGREAPTIVALGDANRDGLVDREEFVSIYWTRRTVDVDQDGNVSAEEFRRARRRAYSNADLDRDRRLRRIEIDDAARFTLFRF